MTNEEFIESIKLEGEEWRTIPDWERYMVSSYGRIVALDLPYKCGSYLARRKPKLLRLNTNKGNPPYYVISLSNGNKCSRGFVVHRLVAKAFIPNPDNLPYINHKDENSLNNHVDNLEWCTQQYNCNYGTHNARMAKTLSETAYQKRKVVQLTLDNEFVKAFDSIKDAADTNNIHRASISICCRKPNRTGKGYRWMYLSDFISCQNSDVKELSSDCSDVTRSTEKQAAKCC